MYPKILLLKQLILLPLKPKKMCVKKNIKKSKHTPF